jgi:hypothetical protein
MHAKTKASAAVFILVGALVTCAGQNAGRDLVPLKDRQRVLSTHGFSFLPPQQSGWLEKFGKNEITYFKETDPAIVSFYTQAIEGEYPAAPSTEAELLAFVRSKKDDWGREGRYSDTSSSIAIEESEKSCVSYWVSAHDRAPTNKGNHEFLVLHTAGRFCLHPQTRSAGVDIFYSVRHIPNFDATALFAEGESFVKSLQFQTPPQ